MIRSALTTARAAYLGDPIKSFITFQNDSGVTNLTLLGVDILSDLSERSVSHRIGLIL